MQAVQTAGPNQTSLSAMHSRLFVERGTLGSIGSVHSGVNTLARRLQHGRSSQYFDSTGKSVWLQQDFEVDNMRRFTGVFAVPVQKPLDS